MSLLQSLKSKFTKPLIGLGVISVSTTLAACYGPPPMNTADEAIREDYCESLLLRACTDNKVIVPAECPSTVEEQEARCNSIKK